MTYILVEPASLEATAAVFRTAAEMLGELGPQVSRACDSVYAPPGVTSSLELDLVTSALALQTVALELLQEAADLARRAACCGRDDASSLPVPALVGLAYGAGASLGGQQTIQFGSAVSAAAASGPGVFPPAASMAAAHVAAPPMSLHAALAGGATLGGNEPLSSTSLHQVLAGGATLGGNQPLGASMVYNPTLTATLGGNAPLGNGIYVVPDPDYVSRNPVWVPRDDARPAGSYSAFSGLVPLPGRGVPHMNSIMNNMATLPASGIFLSAMHNAARATVPNAFMG